MVTQNNKQEKCAWVRFLGMSLSIHVTREWEWKKTSDNVDDSQVRFYQQTWQTSQRAHRWNTDGDIKLFNKHCKDPQPPSDNFKEIKKTWLDWYVYSSINSACSFFLFFFVLICSKRFWLDTEVQNLWRTSTAKIKNKEKQINNSINTFYTPLNAPKIISKAGVKGFF